MDEILSLAIAMDASRGAYALLLGSGVSRAASIPTGWEVVLDLVNRIARARGEDPGEDPAAWYANVFGAEPEYGAVLNHLAKRPTERQALLRSYFEPTDEDREANRKVPTRAHHAVASLVRSGHVRLILTTNFDRLIEQSIEAAGVTPAVISSPSALDGALPLIHSRCTVVKLHGDYQDTRIKNTAAELEKYDRRFTRFLSRGFDEFGLVVCGWSAEWDIALRTAIESCKSRRFTTFWAARGSLAADARKLAALRDAQVIAIQDADSFFSDLSEKVTSLASISQSHPMAAPTAVATLKRFLVDPQRRIDLNDLVQGERERVALAISDEAMPVSGTVPLTAAAVLDRVKRYESLTVVLSHLMAVGCYWGTDEQVALFRDCVARLAQRPGVGGLVPWINLREYPASILLYAGGIAAFVAGRYGPLHSMLVDLLVSTVHGEAPAGEVLRPTRVLETPLANQAFGQAPTKPTPVSDRLAILLREPLRGLLPSDERYEDAFDRFEYFLSCVVYDLDALWLYGRFAMRGTRFGSGDPPAGTSMLAEATNAGEAWPPLRAGFFSGTLSRFQEVAARINELARRAAWG
jgi:hypothetical protein